MQHSEFSHDNITGRQYTISANVLLNKNLPQMTGYQLQH